MKPGLLLLSGGAGTRMGTPKHDLAHPAGGSWAGHLVQVFESVFPGAPVMVLGEPIPERPELPRLDDPREGPAVALQTWAAAEVPTVDRWWVVGCDQVRWTPGILAEWAIVCADADPSSTCWVMAHHGGHLQPLGGFLPSVLRPALARSTSRSLMKMAVSLPHLVLPRDGSEWVDLDTPEDRRTWEGGFS